MKLMLVVLAALAVTLVQSRRTQHRRALEQEVERVKQKFPTQEWNVFWNKLTEGLGDERQNFQAKLEENRGDMDLTLNQFKGKMVDEYPVIQQTWERVKTQYDGLAGKMDQVTVKELFEMIRNYMNSNVGDPNNVQFDEVWGNFKSQLITLWNRILSYANEQGY